MKRVLFLLLFLFTLNVQADGFGFGYCPSIFSFDIDDPDGSTETASDFTALGACGRYDLSKASRFMLRLERFDFDVDASVSNIGQDIESTQFTLLYEKNLKLSRELNRVYLGGGGFFGDLSATSRFTVDSDGFLANTYPNRSLSDYGLALSAGIDWEISKTVDVGFNALYQHSLNDGLSGFRAGIAIFYK